MYTNIWIEDKYSPNATVHLWTDGEDGEDEYMKFPYEDYCYILDEGGRYKSLFGDPVKKVRRRINSSEKEKLREKWGKHHVTFESDVRPEMRVLIDHYKHSDEPSKNHRILWFDIEVSTDPEYPDPQKAKNTVTSVAVYDGSSDTKFVLLLDEDMDDFQYEDVHVRTYADEKSLMMDFLEAWKKIQPTIVVGYNSDYFDIPYTYNRLERLFGEDVANSLSPIDIVEWDDRKERFYIAGISSLDYLQLYKNFTFSELSSYSLDSVANEELDKGKVSYKGREYVPTSDGYEHIDDHDGNADEAREVRDLDDLKEYDPGRFVRYNMEDVMLLAEIDEKRDFIQLARKICHMGHVPYEDIYSSSRFIDGAALTRLAKKGIAAPDCKYYDLNIAETCSVGSEEIPVEDEIPDYVPYKGTLRIWKTSSTAENVPYRAREGDRFLLEDELSFDATPEMDLSLHYKGAYVKEPNGAGRHEWVYDLDLTSMYPSIIMSINISPETKVGRVYGWDAEAVKEGRGPETYEVYLFGTDTLHEFPREKLVKMLRDKGLSIASNGVFYRNDRRGIIPELLEQWYDDRSNFKEERNRWRGEDEEKAEYYDNMQHQRKILINCFDPETDVVTATGIKNIRDVEEGEMVYSVNPDTMEVELKPVTRTYKQAYEGEMVRIQSNHVDFLVTPNHRMLTSKQCGDNYEEYQWRNAEELLRDKRRYKLPSKDLKFNIGAGERSQVYMQELCMECGVGDVEFSDGYFYSRKKNAKKQPVSYDIEDWAAFVGWFASEGSLRKTDAKTFESGNARGESYNVLISQRNESGKEQIRELLDRMGMRYVEDHKDFRIASKPLYRVLKSECGENSESKRVPQWMFGLPNSALNALFNALMAGDGDARGRRYTTKSDYLAQDFIRLCHHVGLNGHLIDTGEDCYRIQVCESRGVTPTIKDDHRSIEEYGGMIHCLEVADNHTVLAGRNGKFNWIGQSVYGVLGLPTFRFYDIDNAMAVTETGRALIAFSQDMGNKYYNEELDTSEDWCVYVDTDSVTGDAVVPTDEFGRLSLQELFERAQEQDGSKMLVEDGREFVFPSNLCTYSTKTGNNARPDPVDYLEKHNTEKRLFRITAKTGETVTVTADHSVMVRTENGGLEECSPTDLEPGDTILRLTE